MTREKITLLLVQHYGKFVSGEEISQALNITRSAVWKHINTLKALGCDIVSVRNRGYKLQRMPDILSPEFFRAVLNEDRQIHCYDQLVSTNIRAKELAQANCPAGTLVIANSQEDGQGRKGRSFYSPPGGVWMSIVLRPDMPPAQVQKFTLIAALAVAQSLQVLIGLDPQIKWPNDILINGKKICGISADMASNIDSVIYVVLGIGVNVNIEQEAIPKELKGIITSVQIEKKTTYSRLELACAMIARLEELLQVFQKSKDFSQFIETYSQYAMKGHVRVFGYGKETTGEMMGIDEEGRLLLKHEDGTIEKILSGDLSLRRVGDV
ncbi:MAG: biotin--[acetyl-CoA-carboxylase] ligase [Christensenellales bacterium]|jgi:BirA family biotin operon repressor/biotin-[acetyl-CoA-carboxylase] ligase